jgi:hypothetical protein
MVENYTDEFLKILDPILVKDWERVLFNVKLGEGSFEAYVFVTAKYGMLYMDVGDLARIGFFQKKDVYRVESSLEQFLRKIREESNSSWTAVLVKIRNSGEISVDYSYDAEMKLGIDVNWAKENLF